MREEMIMAVIAAVYPDYTPKAKSKEDVGRNNIIRDRATKAVDAICTARFLDAKGDLHESWKSKTKQQLLDALSFQALVTREAVQDSKPISVQCPSCKAVPGKPCTHTTNGLRSAVNWFHVTRHKLVI